MSETLELIQRLESLGEGERSRLRRLAGRSLDESLAGFDLFTGLWWPLRTKSTSAPRREIAWLVAKLYGSFPVPLANDERSSLARVLGQCELDLTRQNDRWRFRSRFDTLLRTPLAALEPNLHWALSTVRDAVAARRLTGIDWVQLTEHLSIWDRGDEHRLKRDVRDIWAEEYLATAG